MDSSLNLSNLYQPIPFKEYEDVSFKRNDCEIRYKAIKSYYGDFNGKTLIDIGCSNGYMGFRFLQDGGKSVYGVELDANCRKIITKIALDKSLDFKTSEFCSEGQYDIGLYLDLHFHGNIGDSYIHFLKNNCAVSFIAPSGAGRNEDMEEVLKKYFKSHVAIHKGFSNRNIYRCEP